MDSNSFIRLNLESASIENNIMFFSAWNTNGFFAYDFKIGKTKLLTLLPFFEGSYGYGHLHNSGSKFFLSPCNGNSIVEINKEDWTYKEYPLDDNKLDCHIGRLGTILESGESLFFRPYQAHALVELNMKSREITYHTSCYDVIKQENWIHEGPLYSGAVLYNGKIWFACVQANILLAFDVKNKTTEKYIIGDNNEKFNNIIFDGNNFWVFCESKKIIKWNNVNKEITFFDRIWTSEESHITAAFFQDNLWLASAGFQKCKNLNIKNSLISDVECKGIADDKIAFGKLMVLDNRLFYLPEQTLFLYEIDKYRRVNAFELKLCGKEYEEYCEKIIKISVSSKSIIKENGLMKLSSFINAI